MSRDDLCDAGIALDEAVIAMARRVREDGLSLRAQLAVDGLLVGTVRNVAKVVDSMGLEPVAAQLPIGHWSMRAGTAVDLVLASRDRSEVVLVETKLHGGTDLDHRHGQRNMRGPYRTCVDTMRGRYRAQCEMAELLFRHMYTAHRPNRRLRRPGYAVRSVVVVCMVGADYRGCPVEVVPVSYDRLAATRARRALAQLRGRK